MSTLSVTLVQADLTWGNIPQNLDHIGSMIKGHPQPMEVVFLPEMFSTGFMMEPERLAETMDGQAVNWMKHLAAEKKIILTGSLAIKEGEHYLNRLIWMLPNGQLGT